MDKGSTIQITAKFRQILKDLPERFTFTDTEVRAIEFADELYKKELKLLQTDPNYKGV